MQPPTRAAPLSLSLSLLHACRKKAAEVNKKLGDKFEISDSELASTVDACTSLLALGQDLDAGEGATTVRRGTA